MRVTIGSGKTRQSIIIPSAAAAKASPALKAEQDAAATAIKNYLFNPAALA